MKIANASQMKSLVVTPTNMGKKSDKLSPEIKLGLGIEKLLEQGVRVEKIAAVDSSDGKDEKSSPKKGFGRATNKNICLLKAKPKRRRMRFVVINGTRQRISKLKNESSESKQTNLKSETVKNAVIACVKDFKKKVEAKGLLLDVGEPLFLQVSSVKKPMTPKRFVRFNLPYSYLDDVADVCLIIQDQKSSWNKKMDPELTIDKMQEVLKANNVTCIKKIITLDQFKTEYNRYELNRKLCNSYDFFLADNYIFEDLFPLLGKTFHKSRKVPVLIHLDRGNLNQRIKSALTKSPMKLSSDQDLFSCQIGNSKQKIKFLVKNIVSVGQQLDKLFPGSFKNVRYVAVKTAKSLPFPIYYSTKLPNEVPRPIHKPKRPALYESVSGELSTIGKDVVVHPDGTLQIVGEKKKNKAKQNKAKIAKIENLAQSKEDDNDNDDDDEEENESENEFKFYSNDDDEDDDNDVLDSGNDSDSLTPMEISQKKKKVSPKNTVDGYESDDDSESSDDELSRKTEEAYLHAIDQESEEESSEDDENDDGNEKYDDEEEGEIERISSGKSRKIANQNQNNAAIKGHKNNAKKRKTSDTSPEKFSNQNQKNQISKKEKKKAVKRKTFDTSLGETWSIKRKCETVVPNEKNLVKKKKGKSKVKLNKSQKKGNMKMKKAKLNKN